MKEEEKLWNNDLDALLGGVADIGGGAPETSTTTAGEEMTDLASILVQGAETPPPAPAFAVPPAPLANPMDVSAAEPEALDLAPEALDEDPRVVAQCHDQSRVIAHGATECREDITGQHAGRRT